MDFSEIFLLKLLKPTVYNEKRRFLIITLLSSLLELVSGTVASRKKLPGYLLSVGISFVDKKKWLKGKRHKTF
jgi:hypothetical protein